MLRKNENLMHNEVKATSTSPIEKKKEKKSLRPVLTD